MKRLVTVVLVVGVIFAAEGYHILNKIKIGSITRREYLSVDSAAHRLYATHGTLVDVVDLNAGKPIGSSPNSTMRIM